MSLSLVFGAQSLHWYHPHNTSDVPTRGFDICCTVGPPPFCSHLESSLCCGQQRWINEAAKSV
eukprot:7263406-Ditylum_brightwellii.AAC.1